MEKKHDVNEGVRKSSLVATRMHGTDLDDNWTTRTGSPTKKEHLKPPSHKGDASHKKHITKVSIGILLCRINSETNRPEAAMVHKRYTYEFAEFAHGRYSRNHIRTVTSLLEKMTVDELLDIWSLNFDQIWYRIWLSADKTELYNKKLSKFHTSFIKDDRGDLLRQLVKQVRGSGEPLWEPPGGKKATPKESDMMCAIREMREETGIEKKYYKILPGVRKRISFIHMGVRYVKVYYVALAHSWLAKQELSSIRSIGARAVEQIGEVSEARWMDIIKIRAVDTPSKRLEVMISPVFKLIKSYVSGKWLGGAGINARGIAAEFDLQRRSSAADHPLSLVGKVSPDAAQSEGKWTLVRSKKGSEKKTARGAT